MNYIYFILDSCTATNPSEGTVDDTAPAHGATITYSCTAGYSLSGTATRICTAGVLSGTAPTCNGGILENNYTVWKDSLHVLVMKREMIPNYKIIFFK